MGFADIQNRIKSLNKDELMKESIQENASEAVAMNVDQLEHGIGIDGKSLHPFYTSALYAAEKNAQNPLPGLGVPDLILKGDFTDGFKGEATKDKLTIFSTDIKESFLPKRYPDGQGLTKENQQINNENVSKTYASKYLDKIW